MQSSTTLRAPSIKKYWVIFLRQLNCTESIKIKDPSTGGKHLTTFYLIGSTGSLIPYIRSHFIPRALIPLSSSAVWIPWWILMEIRNIMKVCTLIWVRIEVCLNLDHSLNRISTSSPSLKNSRMQYFVKLTLTSKLSKFNLIYRLIIFQFSTFKIPLKLLILFTYFVFFISNNFANWFFPEMRVNRLCGLEVCYRGRNSMLTRLFHILILNILIIPIVIIQRFSLVFWGKWCFLIIDNIALSVEI